MKINISDALNPKFIHEICTITSIQKLITLNTKSISIFTTLMQKEEHTVYYASPVVFVVRFYFNIAPRNMSREILRYI